MITLYESCGFVNFDFLDFLLDILPDDIRGLSGYNALPDNAQYHPYIFSSTNTIAPVSALRFLSHPTSQWEDVPD